MLKKMKKEVLFIQGGGEKGYEADAKLAASLEQALGEDYIVHRKLPSANYCVLEEGGHSVQQ